MANRVIRDWTASESIDELTVKAEVFFTRLIMKADDFGNYTGNPRLINAALFPLKLYTVLDIISWVNECVTLGLIIRYTNSGKDYINIPNFGQTLRRMKALYPSPTSDGSLPTSDGQVTDKHGQTTAETKRSRNETETETNTSGETPAAGAVCLWPTFEDFWNVYDKKEDRSKCELKWKKIEQAAREKIMQHLELYVRSTPDKKFRKNPVTYLNNKSWDNEIITQTNGITNKREKNTADLAEAFAKRVMQNVAGEQFSGN